MSPASPSEFCVFTVVGRTSMNQSFPKFQKPNPFRSMDNLCQSSDCTSQELALKKWTHSTIAKLETMEVGTTILVNLKTESWKGEESVKNRSKPPRESSWRRERESNPRSKLCRLLPNHSAIAPLISTKGKLLASLRILERETRLELATSTLARLRSTN